MRTRPRLTKTVFGLAAVVSGTWAIYNLRALAEMYESGGGGFVSSAALESLRYIVPTAIAGLLLLLAAAALAGAFTRGVNGLWKGVLFGTFIGGALWLPVQVFFVAVFSGLLIEQRGPSGAIDR